MTSSGLQMTMQSVFVVDDDASVREALENLIESAGLTVRTFNSAEDFLKHWNGQMAGCLVLDVRLPGLNGLELQTKLSEAGLPIPIIIMTAHGDVPMVRSAFKAGALEFLTKPFQGEELLEAISKALAVNRAHLQASLVINAVAARYETLSARERQVMELVTDGMMNKDIADELHLSVPTVKLYRRQVMDKMQADSVADLVRMRERIGSAQS